MAFALGASKVLNDDGAVSPLTEYVGGVECADGFYAAVIGTFKRATTPFRDTRITSESPERGVSQRQNEHRMSF